MATRLLSASMRAIPILVGAILTGEKTPRIHVAERASPALCVVNRCAAWCVTAQPPPPTFAARHTHICQEDKSWLLVALGRATGKFMVKGPPDKHAGL